MRRFNSGNSHQSFLFWLFNPTGILRREMEMRCAIDDVIDVFRTANLVGLGERHGTREDAAFRLKLIQNAAFAETVNDIVVEFANPLYQDLLDDFVNGGTVLPAELQQVWRNTTQPGAWDSPVYEDFLRAVRRINAGLPRNRHLRVLAGDQPIEWKLGPLQRRDIDERDITAASVIEREVLARERRALVIFGSLHLYRNLPGTIPDRMKDDRRAKWFSTIPVAGPGLSPELAGQTASPDEPVLIRLDRNSIGGLNANDFFEIATQSIKLVDGKPLILEGKPVFEPARIFQQDTKAREVADACLFFGSAPPDFVSPNSQTIDDEYRKELRRRRAIVQGLL